MAVTGHQIELLIGYNLNCWYMSLFFKGLNFEKILFLLQLIQGGVKSVSIRNSKHNNLLQFIQGEVKMAIYINSIHVN